MHTFVLKRYVSEAPMVTCFELPKRSYRFGTNLTAIFSSANQYFLLNAPFRKYKTTFRTSKIVHLVIFFCSQLIIQVPICIYKPKVVDKKVPSRYCHHEHGAEIIYLLDEDIGMEDDPH